MKIVLFSLNASRTHTNLAIRCLAKSLRQNGFNEVVLIELADAANMEAVKTILQGRIDE